MTRKFLAENFALNVSDKLNNHQVKHFYNLFIDSINWSRDELVSFQVKRIKELLEYSYHYSPFFEKRFNDAGFNFEQFKYLDELKNIPLLTRNDLQNNLKEIITTELDLSKCSKGSSSGSTGHPVLYYHDKIGTSANKAAVLFGKFLGGYNLGDPWINIWGNPTAVNVDWKKPGSRLKKFFSNESRFPAYRLNTLNQFENLYELVLNKKPKFIYGYTNAIFLFSKYLEEKSVKLDFVKGVLTTAENLQPFQKNKIEERLGKVYDQFGCSEINGIAVQTKFDEYYSVLDPHVVVEYGEVVDPINNVKKIIITDLQNRILPFIRYENGDLAAPYENNDFASSKLKYSKFKTIDGRISDIIKLPNGGSLVVPSFFGSRMLKNIDGIKQYQIIKFNDKISVNLIIDGELSSDSKKIIQDTLSDYIPKEITTELVFNNEIIYSSNGKFKLFVDRSVNN